LREDFHTDAQPGAGALDDPPQVI